MTHDIPTDAISGLPAVTRGRTLTPAGFAGHGCGQTQDRSHHTNPRPEAARQEPRR